MLPGIHSIAGVAQSGLRVGASGISESTSALTTYNFASCNIDQVADDRYVIVAIRTGDGGSNIFGVSSITVNGVSGVEATDYNGANASWYASTAMYIAKVSSGTSVTISVTHTEAVTGCTIAWLVVYGLTSTTAYAATSNSTGSASSVNMSVNTTSPGILCGIHYHLSNGVAQTSWDEITTVLYDQDDNGGTGRIIFGYALNPPTGTPTVVTSTLASSSSYNFYSIATFV